MALISMLVLAFVIGAAAVLSARMGLALALTVAGGARRHEARPR